MFLRRHFSARLVAAILVGTALAAVALPGRVRAAEARHDFLAIDEGLGNLFRINQRQPGKDWLVHVAQPTPRDLQLVGGGRVLVGHDAGFSEYDLASGKLLKAVAIYKGVTSARRLANGHTLLAGVNLGGASGVVLLEITDVGDVARKVVLPGKYVRLVRETAAGTYLLMNDTMIREVTNAGEPVHEWTVPGFRHAWKAVRLGNGHTLASAGYGAFMVELDERGSVTRSFGGKDAVPAGVKPNFYGMFQLLADGHVVVANWQGHGPGHGSSGVQLLEFDAKGAIVWQWSEAAKISSLQGVLVLDGLDPAVLHDECNGVMAPRP
jgi:hypothetical protein